MMLTSNTINFLYTCAICHMILNIICTNKRNSNSSELFSINYLSSIITFEIQSLSLSFEATI